MKSAFFHVYLSESDIVHSFYVTEERWGWEKVLLHSEIEEKGFLAEDTLKVHCLMTEGETLEWTDEPTLLSQQLESLVDDEEFSGIKIVTSTKSFSASKNILMGKKNIH